MELNRVNLGSRRDLAVARRVVVPIGLAPDGLPLLCWVERGSPPRELMEPIAARLGYRTPEDYQGEPFGELVDRLEEIFGESDLQEVPTESGHCRCFISRQRVRQITGGTLLSRLLALEESLHPGELEDRAVDTRQAVAAEPAVTEPRVREQLGELRLAVPLDDELPALLARRVHRGKRQYAFVSSRPLIPESLASLRSARFVAEQAGESYPIAEGSFSTGEGYRYARQHHALETVPPSWACWVERRELCKTIAEIAKALGRLHAAGEVHGDLKPQNVLLEQGPRLIDSLELHPGEPSIAMTPGWAAPEQVLGEPVSPATDQYPIGVMLRHLLGGVMFGEEITMVVPTGGAKVERFTLLKNPGVYLDPDRAPLPREGIAPWQRLLARCLAFSPGQRFPGMAELLGELETVAGRFPPQGELALWLSFGSALVRTDAASAEPELAWLAYEHSVLSAD
jgi:hypothetical protein